MSQAGFPSFEIGAIRPPSEGGGNSLLLRVTRNCPWSRCKFCYGSFYGRAKFELRSVDDIKRDIRAVFAIGEAIRQTSVRLGRAGRLDDITVAAMLRTTPDLRWNSCFVTVFNWLHSGARTAFLQDADSLIMRPSELAEVLGYLKSTFPTVERVTSYARSKTVRHRTIEELSSLREAGLVRLHIGLETGDDELLRLVDKGVTSAQHIEAGLKAKEAGMELSQYVMPDLGGRELSHTHAKNTARVLNSIDPDYIRFRPLVPRAGTPMYDDYLEGRLHLSSPHERLREIREMIETLNVNSHVCFDHFANSWRNASGTPLFRQDYEGYKFPERKHEVMSLIEEGLGLDESAHTDVEELIQLPHL